MTYEIAYGDNIHQLERRVNEKIAEGFKPIGGVTAAVCLYSSGEGIDGTSYENSVTFYQAMLKE